MWQQGLLCYKLEETCQTFLWYATFITKVSCFSFDRIICFLHFEYKFIEPPQPWMLRKHNDMNNSYTRCYFNILFQKEYWRLLDLRTWLLWCEVEYPVRNLLMFRKILLPPSSGLKFKLSKRTESRVLTWFFSRLKSGVNKLLKNSVNLSRLHGVTS